MRQLLLKLLDLLLLLLLLLRGCLLVLLLMLHPDDFIILFPKALPQIPNNSLQLTLALFNPNNR